MTLEQLEANQDSMRTDIDSMQAKMDRLLETMLLLAQKEKDAETNAETRKVAAQFGSPSLSIPEVTNLDGNPAQPRGGPIPIPIPMVNVNPHEHSATSARHRSMMGDKDPYDAFFMPQPTKPVIGGFPDPAIDRLHALEEKFKSLEVHTTPGLEVVNMCLVPGLVIPQKFKVPNFDKYKGMSCPRTHLRAYCRKMAAHISNDQLLIHYFQDRLSGASLEWYMQLERGQVQSWRDLAEVFLRHYQYNTDLAPNRTQLQDMTVAGYSLPLEILTKSKIRSGVGTATGATVFSGETSSSGENCRHGNLNQMERSIYQSKEEVVYITLIPCTSTLDLYKWRNQSWKYDGVHHELHVFAKLKAQIKCLY
ncbi:hypothetical protein KIW84_043805 [Lathyrus oleraceus]|uniref:Retrotransposon gag domain-containing protein n=1 Tax=Pisum sativum TaxID=3888 RepID=A0A9D5AUJ9_PEA|nr:hypothetical protein KIW84_043805 [Pisum sativum]